MEEQIQNQNLSQVKPPEIVGQNTPQISTQPPAIPTTPVSTEPDPNKKLKIIGIVIGVLVVIFALIIFILPLFQKQESVIVPKTEPPITIETPEVVVPKPKSKYATDAGVLQIKDRLKKVSDQINSVNFYEPELTFPVISSQINIE